MITQNITQHNTSNFMLDLEPSLCRKMSYVNRTNAYNTRDVYPRSQIINFS